MCSLFFEYKDKAFREVSQEWAGDTRFVSDFKELYKYYKETVFTRFRLQGPYFYMIFQVGKSITDVKAFKWQIKDGQVTYLGNRFDHEVTLAPQYEFEWTRAHRDLHRKGAHPHISIEDKIFVETVGGDLTIKIEDNTDSGEGIYSEPVLNKDQTLDDAEIFYAIVGNMVLLKVKPFQETQFRTLVYNGKTNQVLRIDTINQFCIMLPDGQGIIFPNGFFSPDRCPQGL